MTGLLNLHDYDNSGKWKCQPEISPKNGEKTMEKVAFHNLGCKVNAYEMELMQQNFMKYGYEIVPFSEKADIYIVNTCTVTNIADRKSRQMLHRAKNLNPDAVVVAAGCYVQTDPDGAREDECIDLLVSNKDKAGIVGLVREYIDGRKCSCDEDRILKNLSIHTRAYIKIQDGCDQYCTYCIIPYSRGHVTSRDGEEILSEIRQLVSGGCSEFVITGIHLSSYGLETAYNKAAQSGEFNNEALTEIIRRISDIEGVGRIRLGSLEPRIITNDFLKNMADTDAFCPHFHLSLQSGSDPVLKRMNRRYDTAEFMEKVGLIRDYFEHPAITSDVIVGFPQETEEEFEETREFLNRADLYETHVFAYSRRKGTVADKMPGQLTAALKNKRSGVLISESRVRAAKFREYYIGRTSEVLVEEPLIIDGRKYMTGYNREYVRFAISADESLTGRIVTVSGREMINDELVYADPV